VNINQTNEKLLEKTNSSIKLVTKRIKKTNIPISINCCRNKTIGNSMTSKDGRDIRLVYQNINSLRPKSIDKWKASLDRIRDMEADIVGLCETCIYWNLNKTRQLYKNAIKRSNNKYSCIMAIIPTNYPRIH
jgi:hypothetical protein